MSYSTYVTQVDGDFFICCRDGSKVRYFTGRYRTKTHADQVSSVINESFNSEHEDHDMNLRVNFSWPFDFVRTVPYAEDRVHRKGGAQ